MSFCSYRDIRWRCERSKVRNIKNIIGRKNIKKYYRKLKKICTYIYT